jgi:hypothetical protein
LRNARLVVVDMGFLFMMTGVCSKLRWIHAL